MSDETMHERFKKKPFSQNQQEKKKKRNIRYA